MPEFSQTSLSRLKTCHEKLQILFMHVISHYDCTIVQGHRDEATQNKYYEEGKSKLKWPNSNHNSFPSKAVDAAPYIAGKGIVWDKEQCYHFAGFVQGCAAMMGIRIRWGGDWDMDKDIHDQSFDDLVHFELL